VQKEENLWRSLTVAVRLGFSFQFCSYLRENACKKAEFPEGSDLLIQTKDGSTDRHFFNCCSYLLNNFVQLQTKKFYWCITALDFATENNVFFPVTHLSHDAQNAVRRLSGKFSAILNISRTGRVVLM
jgi:hypothetical protein